MKILIIATTLLIVVDYLRAHSAKHTCNHDEIQSANIPDNYIEEFESNYGNRRLQGSDPQPFRVTYDVAQLYNVTNGEGMTDEKRNYLIALVKTA